MKIGIMGGTFNPIHNGHLILADCAYREFKLDKIWFLPNGNPPHKENDEMETNIKQRVDMVKAALTGDERYELCLYEADENHIYYSYATMENFRKKFPQHQFYFIIGADSLFDMVDWKYPERQLPICTILAACRDDIDTKSMRQQMDYLNQKYHGDIRLLKAPVVPAASSEIRRELKSGENAADMVPAAVMNYIQTHHLYEKRINTHG